jgi:hypothetical protein
MMFDDPAVADEFLLVPSVREHPSDSTTGSTVSTVNILVVRSLVHPEIAIGIDRGRSLYLSAAYNIVP